MTVTHAAQPQMLALGLNPNHPEEAVRAAVRFAAERAAETEREDVREIERLLAAFAAWADIGDENELFQNFKYLWHFVAAYGEAAEAPPEISPFKKHPQVL